MKKLISLIMTMVIVMSTVTIGFAESTGKDSELSNIAKVNNASSVSQNN